MSDEMGANGPSGAGGANAVSSSVEVNAPKGWERYKYIYPPNARGQEQLDIMLRMEASDRDPMAPEYIEQEILFMTKYWHVSRNRFPYEGAEQQFLIVAMEPVYRIEDMTPEMWLDLQQVWYKLMREYQMEGGAFCMRFGDPARSGASLTRLHAHLIMPAEGQKVRPPIGGKKALKPGLHL